jgi:hypothetical protein
VKSPSVRACQSFSAVVALLQLPLQLAERGQFPALEFLDPPLADLVDRHRVEIVQLLAAVPQRGDEVGLFENDEVFCHRLPRHGEAVA